VTAEQVDRAISMIGGKSKPTIGFAIGDDAVQQPSQRGIAVNRKQGKEPEQ